jgi:CMP-N-acetylneuraminic acid synthetase
MKEVEFRPYLRVPAFSVREIFMTAFPKTLHSGGPHNLIKGGNVDADASTKASVRILGVIPARGGSKGVPRKNIATLAGRPLISYTIDVASQSTMIDATIVTTDDQEIAEIARSLGADVPFLRPEQLAADDSPDIDYLAHALACVEENRDWRPEIVAVLQPTLPFRTVADVDSALRFMISQECDSVRTLAIPRDFTPFKMWFLDEADTGRMSPVLKTEHWDTLLTDVPRQKLRPAYWQPGVLIATRTEFIKAGRVFGPDVRGFVVPMEHAHDIDEPLDLEFAEFLMTRKLRATRVGST